MFLRLASLALVLASSAPAGSAAPAVQDVFYRVALDELELTTGERPSWGLQTFWQAPDEIRCRLPYAAVGGGEAYVRLLEHSAGQWSNGLSMEGAELCVRVPGQGEVRGALFLPNARWDAMVRTEFRIPGGASTPQAEEAFARAKAWHYEELLRRRVAGGAWFRHQLGLLPGPARAEAPARDPVEPLALFQGGRAVSENLQLERTLPETEPGQEVALDALEGVSTPAFAFGAEEGAPEPRLDPLARWIPGDQHALFFPSFDALVRAADEAEAHGAPLAEAFEARASSAHVRARYERQLCLSLDAVTRALGPAAVASVAITGSDPYLRSGSDVAVLLEPRAAGEALGALLAARQDLALEADDAQGLERVEGQVAGVSYRGLVAPGRAVCSYLARVGEAWVVTNSLVQLERLARVVGDPAASLAAAPETAFFRRRYVRDEEETAFLLLPDAAIRRWCGPRWRIGAMRRVLAAARLAELQASHVDALLGLAEAPVELTDEAGTLGALEWGEDGVRSSVYGGLAFQTPIAELDFERVSAEEARLYGLWRDGYQRNWSGFFDPIALQLRLSGERLELDLSVIPLILSSEYRDLAELTGDARLAPAAGDRHAGTLFHFAMALDSRGELLRNVNQALSALMSDAGVDLLDWLGGALAIYAEPAAVLEELAQAEDTEQALEDLWVELEQVPLVLHLDVKSPLKLAAFLVALRTMADQTAPGAAVWETRSHGDERYVRIGSDMVGDDFAIYYATPPGAFVLTFSEETLKGTLDRRAARQASGEREDSQDAGWLGESMALELDGKAIELFSSFAGEELSAPLRRASWNNLPILNEWRRRHPERDPVVVHRELWHEELSCPGGGRYVWNHDWQTMESTAFGHPGEPRRGPSLPQVYRGVASLSFGLTLIDDGLRARAVWRRSRPDER